MHEGLVRPLSLFLLLGLASCGDTSRPSAVPVATSVGTPTSEVSTQTIGSAGGTLASADGSLLVEVPPGAVDADTTFSVQAVTNHAHGGLGSAYRLGPEGATFAVPVRLHFAYDASAVEGTAPALLRVATQDAEGFWRVHRHVALDEGSATVSVDASHFSDWSLVTGAILSPAHASVRTGRTVDLQVVVCEYIEDEDPLLAPLAAPCRPTELLGDLVETWSVNGIAGGDASAGTVTARGKDATYRAPSAVPNANPVAVAAAYTSLFDSSQVLLVANVTVVPSGCMGETPLEPCVLRLGTFDGQPLPYDDLPREAWQNPEILTTGELVIDDFDGDGYGTWAVEWTYTEQRVASDLEHVVRIAGRFEPTAEGETRFVTLDGVAFHGSVGPDAAALRAVPFYTANTTLAAQMKFVR